MNGRLNAMRLCALALLLGCSSKRDLGNLPDGGAGNMGIAGGGGATAGQGGGGGGGVGGIGGDAAGTAGGGGATGAAGMTGTGGGGGGGTGGTAGAGAAGTVGTGGGTGGTPAACDVTHPFGTPVLAAGLDGATGSDDGTARLSADELTAYFYSDRAPGYRIYTATRASRTDPFGTPQVVGGIASGAGGEFKFPTLTADGLTIFFESDPGSVYTVMVASRATTAAQFSASAPAAGINAGPDDSQPFVLPDGSALYFMSTRNNADGSADLYRAARGPSGQFLTPTRVPFVNTTSTGQTPVVTPDELVLFYSSARTDPPFKGGWDIWMATRASSSVPFDAPVNVQEVNTAGLEIPDWISPDRCRLYFDRLNSNGTGDKIYVAERAP